MCGICGYALGTTVEPPPLNAMMNLLHHRGPDGDGKLDDGQIAVGVRRLAIIDVAGGDQPIPNEDESVWVILNGEIYNYQDLRQDLVLRGHTLRTESDTEVLVHLYEDQGEEMLQELRGMFALCIYDRRDRSLLLARDPFGEKPLFYSFNGKNIVFSSEVTSLLACGTIPRRLDHEALNYYLRVGFVPSPLTMFRDIKQVEPGRWLRWKEGSLTHGCYWSPTYVTSHELQDEVEAKERVAEAMRRALTRQLVSERPIGAFLSGGIDSSLLVAFCQEVRPEPLKTFTIGFEESSYDEGWLARLVAKYVGTDHHEHQMANAQFEPELLSHIIERVGLPLADSSAMATYLISKVASQYVTVCLSGEGGDEMFGGYPQYRWGLTLQRLSRIPKPLLSQGERIARWAASVNGLGRSRLLRQASRAFQVAQSDNLAQTVELHALFNQKQTAELIADPRVRATMQTSLNRIHTLPPEGEEWSPLKRLMYFRWKYILAEDYLVKTDRMGMSCSLEIRSPFLDLDLAKLAMTLPDRHVIRGREQKYILRQLAKSRLPSEVLEHPKSGLFIPMHRFQNPEYQHMASELLNPRTGLMELFCPTTIERVRSDALTRDRDMADASLQRVGAQLWALMQLAAWGQRYTVDF